MAVKFTSRIKQWTIETETKIDIAVGTLATDIHKVATMNAPEDTSALINSAKVVRKSSGHWAITFGSSEVPYARIRHFENKKTPSSLRYLERAGDDNARNIKRYLKDI